jgi:hypothetical protein
MGSETQIVRCISGEKKGLIIVVGQPSFIGMQTVDNLGGHPLYTTGLAFLIMVCLKIYSAMVL